MDKRIQQRGIQKDICGQFEILPEKKGLVLHAWVIMTNHVHLVTSSNSNKPEHIVRDLKKYTRKQIIKAIQANNQESRKE